MRGLYVYIPDVAEGFVQQGHLVGARESFLDFGVIKPCARTDLCRVFEAGTNLHNFTLLSLDMKSLLLVGFSEC